jgi:hypothetical protein
MASFEDFKKQLLEMAPGERLAYHVGSLAEDRLHNSTVNKTAIVCMGLQLLGRAILNVQRLDKTRSAYYITLSAATARPLQPSEVVRAWTLGQEVLAASQTR